MILIRKHGGHNKHNYGQMKDLIKYTETGVVPDYLPGISGYGQKGSFGNPGDSGASVYFTPFDLSNDFDKKACTRLVNLGYELSDNYEKKADKPYMAGDMIIDCKGGIYTLSKADVVTDGPMGMDLSPTGYKAYKIKLVISPAGGSSDSAVFKQKTSYFKTLNIRCSTSSLKSSGKMWKYRKGKYEVFSDTSSMPRMYYRNKYCPYIYGNYVTFTLLCSPNTPLDNFSFRYVLVFPNGQTFEKTETGVTRCTMFIDNSFVFGCFDEHNRDQIRNLRQHEDDIIVTEGIENIVEGTLGEVVNFRGPVVYGEQIEDNVYGKVIFNPNKEDDVDVSNLCSFFIKNNCTGYVEVTNMVTSKTYRIDVDDTYTEDSLDGSGTIGNDNNIEYIESNEPMITWASHVYPQYKWILDPNGTHKRPYEEEGQIVDASVYRPMDVYVTYNKGYDFTEADDGRIIPWYYTGEEGISDNVVNVLNDGYFSGDEEIHATPAYQTWSDPASDNYKRNLTMRMYFKNLRNINMTIKFTKAQGSFTSTMLYIGVPDCNLLQFGLPQDVIDELIAQQQSQNQSSQSYQDDVNTESAEDEQNTETESPRIIVGRDGAYNVQKPGIYYLHKAVPPNIYEDNLENVDLMADAGLINLTINLNELNLSPKEFHFIEFGIVSYGKVHDGSELDGSTNHQALSVSADHIENLYTPIGMETPGTKPLDVSYYNRYCGTQEMVIYVNTCQDSTETDSESSVTTKKYNPSKYWQIDYPNEGEEDA